MEAQGLAMEWKSRVGCRYSMNSNGLETQGQATRWNCTDRNGAAEAWLCMDTHGMEVQRRGKAGMSSERKCNAKEKQRGPVICM